MSFSDWFTKNKVLIIGLLSAVALPLYDLASKGETSLKVIIISALVAATSFLAKNLRGQWQTIATVVGAMVAAYVAQDKGGGINWWQIIMTGVVLFLGASSSPAKSIGYEHTEVITAAKKEGEAITPTPAPPPAEPSIKYTPNK